ncbi:SO2930 family diheme c-type cytochrome [Solitalea longa]|uniref:SO2930 family diheme c-type cytochrome n=1 Tax=Solitalea longa TaxID=2079460 RepID=UPI001A9C7ECB|nr:SO2930 family diheme c-type cytochrome [Solitalea longa]
MRKIIVIACLLVVACTLSFKVVKTPSLDKKDKLSEYGFFSGKMADLAPVNGVVPYSLNTTLFSNYAEKLRFVRIPEGTKVTYTADGALEFPVGTILIKNFYYPNDFRNLKKGRKIIETRLLVRQENEWVAWPYIWNEDQTDAVYDVAGETRQISYVDINGKKVVTNYVIPNKNQCKGCHSKNQSMQPIGPSAMELNRTQQYASKAENQLMHWQKMGMFDNLPDLKDIPKLAVWNDPKKGTLDERARAYLDINCGHCHRKEGPANTSGLFLNVGENQPAVLGVMKAPIAAGRGSGNRSYDR